MTNSLESLSQKLNTARLAWNQHPQFHVEPFYRYQIYTAMGPRCENGIFADSPRKSKAGVLRRVHLATLTAKKTLPIWENTWQDWSRIWSDDDLALHLIHETERSLKELTHYQDMDILLRVCLDKAGFRRLWACLARNRRCIPAI